MTEVKKTRKPRAKKEEQKKEEPVEDLKPPEVKYTHKQMLQAFGL